MRTVIADFNVQKYLNKLVDAGNFSYGVIIGQPTQHSRDYIIHVARTPHDTIDKDSHESIATHASSIDSISIPLLVDHAVTVIRMIPGSFYVLGIYISGGVNIFEDNVEFEKVKTIVRDLTTIFRNNKTMFASTDYFNNGDMLVLYYNDQSELFCKSVTVPQIETNEEQQESYTVDWRFDNLHLHQIETIYDTDYIFPLIKRPNKPFNLEENICFNVDDIGRRLEQSLLFIDGEPFESHEDIEHIMKVLQVVKTDAIVLQGSIYFPCKEKINEEETKIIRYDGTLQYTGIVYSKIWVHTKCEFKLIEYFIKADILRSISSRLRLYLDTASCVESTHSSNMENIVITEPPRRILFEFSPLSIMFSDYLFRHENEDTVITQAKDILDIDIHADMVICNIERIPDEIEDLFGEQIEMVDPVASEENNPNNLYAVGIILAFGVLLISLGYHYIFVYD